MNFCRVSRFFNLFFVLVFSLAFFASVAVLGHNSLPSKQIKSTFPNKHKAYWIKIPIQKPNKQFMVHTKIPAYLNVREFGARGDGVNDDQSTIVQGIAAAERLHLPLYFPPGNYLHSGLLVDNGAALFGAGASSIVTATNSSFGAIELTGNGPSLSSMALQYANPVQASFNLPDTAPQAGDVWVQSATNFAVSNVTMTNSSQNNMDIFQSSTGIISNNQVTTISSMDDGIQIVDSDNVQLSSNNFAFAGTNAAIDALYGNTGSQNLSITANTIQSNNTTGIYLTGVQSTNVSNNAIYPTGGSGISVQGQSASSPSGPVNNLDISGNTIQGSSNYEGIALDDLSGTGNFINNVQVSQNNIAGSGTAILCSFTGNNINITSNTASNCGAGILGEFFGNSNNITSNIVTNSTGGIQLTGSGSTGNSISISSNTVTNTSSSYGIYVDKFDSVTLSTNTINTVTGSGYAGFWVNDCITAIITSNTVQSTNVDGIIFTATTVSTTSATISSNNLSNCCLGSSGDIIFVSPQGSTISGLAIQNNNYAGPANNATYYIDSEVPGSATNPNISGNTQTTSLPNNLAP